MTLVIKVIVAVLVVLVSVTAALRIRKLRRDDPRGEAATAKGLMAPPPSPYATSKGFRLVESTTTPTSDEKHAAPPRPRLEPIREYIFGEAQVAPYDVNALAQQRHDEHWALSRSVRRAKFTPSLTRKLTIALGIALMLAIGMFYLFHHTTKANPTRSSPTTSTTLKVGVSSPLAGAVSYSSFEVISFNTKASTWASSRHVS